jgi:hypothetical protein
MSRGGQAIVWLLGIGVGTNGVALLGALNDGESLFGSPILAGVLFMILLLVSVAFLLGDPDIGGSGVSDLPDKRRNP